MATPFADFVRRALEKLERGLARAGKVADDAATKALDAVRQAREVRDKLREDERTSGAGPIGTRVVGAQRELSGLQKRADALRGKDVDSKVAAAVRQAFSAANRGATIAAGIAAIGTTDDGTAGGAGGLSRGLQTLATVASLAGPQGALLAALAAAVGAALAKIEVTEARRVADLDRLVSERIDRAIRRADSTQRYREDARFRQQEDERAREIYVSRRNAGFEPRSAAALDGF